MPSDDDDLADLYRRLYDPSLAPDLDPLLADTRYTGRLLVATPAIGAEPFHRSVVLVLHHDADGAQGVILDKVTTVDIDRVLPGWGDHASEPATMFHGGPVAEDSALGIVSVPGGATVPGVNPLFAGFGVVDLDQPPQAVVESVAGLRLFAGYAGWTAGQLEAEVGSGGWYVVDLEPGDVYTDDPGTLWRRVLRRQTDRLSLVSWFPPDPSLN